MGTLDNMSRSAIAFLETSPNSMVLTHETDHDMVDNPKRTHKSWKQIHWHMRTLNPKIYSKCRNNQRKKH